MLTMFQAFASASAVLSSMIFLSLVAYADVLPFDQFPAGKKYQGKTIFPQFEGRDRAYRDYRTRIRDGLKSGPNFAGEYSVIQIGCGTGCSFVYIASNRTGQVFEFPRGGENNSSLDLAFNVSSRLLYAQWENYDEDNCVLEEFEWTAKKVKLLKSVSVGKRDACYEEIEKNLASGKAMQSPPPKENADGAASENWEGMWARSAGDCAFGDPSAGMFNHDPSPINLTRSKFMDLELTCDVKSLISADNYVAMDLKCSGEGNEWDDKLFGVVKNGMITVSTGYLANTPLVKCKLDKMIEPDFLKSTKIIFDKGAVQSSWHGTIVAGVHEFSLSLGENQYFSVGGPDVYTWSAISSNGRKLGCNRQLYCAPDDTLVLPEKGEYLIVTDFRMSDCASCATAKEREVTVIFTAQ